MNVTYHQNYRRTRGTPIIRNFLSEVHIRSDQLIQPFFIKEGLQQEQEITALSGQKQHTIDSLQRAIEDALLHGVKSFLLFIVPSEEKKREREFDYDFDISVIKKLKDSFGRNIFLWCDVCLCSNTLSGHCGFLLQDTQGVQGIPSIDNHQTVLELCRKSLLYAQAGADGIAPSDMMDDRVAAIRDTLDQNQLHHKLLMSYSAKFASNFYGPFRAAANSSPASGDRKSYQLDYTHTFDAIRCAIRDLQQGADVLMVKPAGIYLDIIYRLKYQQSETAGKIPIAAYQVSGEYQALKLLAQSGLANFDSAYFESLCAIKRAGADLIITYGATLGAKLSS
ncbi:MAG: porphobilinogen synthase [Oligoflexia bacterium]|nr:porphobilinogen synthase [Oligoflexia bacterium]